MKKLEDFTKRDLWSLRQQIVLNSIYLADYRNNFGISERSVATFMEGYYDYLWELAEEKGYNTHKDVMDKLDKASNLYSWFLCYDDFSWVEYES